MASKQTRRSISVRGTTYALLRDFCAEHDRSMSDVVEELLGRILEGSEAAAPAKKTVAPLVARAPQPVREPVPERVERPVRLAPPVREEAAVRVEAPAPKPAPAPRAAIPARPAPARPVPIANAGRPAPTPASKVEGTQRDKDKPRNGDYRAIRF